MPERSGRAREALDRGRGAWLPVALRVILVLVLAAAVVGLLSTAGYRVSTGSVSFQVRPAWRGGHLIMPLGPAGELSLHTHRTPVDVVMVYQLPSETAALTDGGGLAGGLPRLEGGAQAAFGRWLATRVPWLLAIGAAAGLLAVGGWTRRRALWGAGAGAVAVLGLGAVLLLASYATIDRTPAVQYRGLASRVPEILPLLRALSTGGDQDDNLRRLQDALDGLEAVATQLTAAPRRPARAEVVRFLLASDIHDNVFGVRAAARLAAGGGQPVDAVLLAGDLTDLGTAEEARLFVRVFGRVEAPVIIVGGNHEDRPAMDAFAKAGYRILEGTSAAIAGVAVIGASDPVARTPRVASDTAALAAAGLRLAALWQAPESRAQVLLVHDIRQASAVIAAAEGDGRALVVAYGNDHVGAVTERDGVVLVDAGTAGASGYEAIGAEPPTVELEPSPESRTLYTFQLIDFSRRDASRLVAVTKLTYSGDGRTVVTYIPFED